MECRLSFEKKYLPARNWRKVFFSFSLAILLLVSVAGQLFGAGGAIIWQAGDQQLGRQIAKASAADSQGNVIVTGYQNFGGFDSYYTSKFKADGSGVLWRATFSQAGGNAQATAMAIDGNDNIIVTGYMWNGVNNDIHTVKYRGSDGVVLWEHTFNGSANGNDLAAAVAIDTLNNVYVGGSSQGASGADDFTVIKYAASGPLNNSPLWQTSYNGPANGMDNLYDISASTSGVAVTGWSHNGTAFDMLTIKYDLSGNKLWEVRTPSNGGAMGKKVRMDAAGNVVVSGYAADSLSKNIYTAKYRSSDGSRLWERSYSTPEGYDEECNDLFVDSSGEVFVAGYTFINSGLKKVFYTARYGGANGSLIWSVVSNITSDADEALALTVDGTGDIFVTGYAESAGDYDFLTVKYQRDTGNERWSQRFNGVAALNDRPVGIGLSPAGDLLIGGWSETASGNSDYYAIKYDPEQLPRPTDLVATTLSNNSVQLNWADNSGTEESFRVERKLGETGSFSEITSLPANAISYTDIGLSGNNTYYYRVRGYNTPQGFSHYSNEAHALTAIYNNIAFARTTTYNGQDNQNDYANAIAIGPDENPVITGYSQTTSFGNNYATVKLDRTNLSTIWSSQYDDPDSGTDEALCLAVDSNNNTIVSGHANLYFSQVQRNIPSILTLKYPAIGPPETWAGQYNGPGGIDDRPRAVAASTDSSNNLAVVGYGVNSANNIDTYLLKYNQAGSLVWAATPFDGPGHGDDIPSAAVFGPDGSIYVTGYSEKGAGAGKYYLHTAKYNGSNGALIWSDLYSVQAGGDNRGNAITVDSTGDVYVTGSATNSSGNSDIYTIKYSGSSNSVQHLWERSLDGAAHGDDQGVAIAVDPYDGAIVVAGSTLTDTGNNDFSIVRYSSAGDMLWQKTVLRPDNDDVLKGLSIDPSGTIYLTGDTTNAAGGVDILSVIVDSTGNILAYSSYDGSGHSFDQAIGVVTNSKGEAFIGGTAINASGNSDYVVLKQSSTNYIIPIPTPFNATQQADYSKINTTWSNNLPGSSFRIERTPGPVTAGSSWTTINTANPAVTSFMDSGLNPGTSYCYRIEAFSGSFSSKKMISCATTTLPQPVVSLTLVSATAIDINWNNINSNSGYKIERSSDNMTWSQLGGNLPTDTTVYHDTGLTAGQVYYYRVSTLSSAGASLATQQVAPALTSTTAVSSTEIDLAWPTVNGAGSYLIERSIDNAAWTQIAAQGSTGYQNLSLTPGTTYYYRVRAVTASGTSIPSLVRTSQSWPATPTLNLVTAVAPNQVNLSWNSSAGATGYTIWESTCSNYWVSFTGYWNNGSYVSIPVSPNNCDNYPQYISWSSPVQVGSTSGQGATTFTRTGVTPSARSSYYVKAVASSSTSPASNIMKTWTPPQAASLSYTATDTTLTVSWNNAYVTTASVLERSLDGITGWTTLYNISGYYSPNNLQFIDTGRSPSTSYYYRVTNSGVAAPQAITPVMTATTLPGGPAVTAVTLAGSQITVAWGNLTGNLGYEVKRWHSSDATPTYWYDDGIINNSIAQNSSSYIDNISNSGAAYKYQIRAKLAGNSYSGWGSDSGLWKRMAPAIPTNVYTNGLYLSWNGSSGSTSYAIQYMQPVGSDCSTGTWLSLASTSSTSYTPALVNTNSWCFKVSASNETGSSAASTPAIYLPPPTTFTLGTSTVSTIPLSWSTVPGNTGYKVERYPYYYSCQQWNGSYYWTTCGPIWTVASDTVQGATSFTDSGLVSNTAYQYRISTKYANGGYGGYSVTKISSPSSKATLALGNMTLTGLTVDSASQITINWSDVPGNNGYKLQRSLDNVNWIDVVITDAGATSYSNSGLNSGTRYYYRGQARDGAGTYTALSSALNATTPLTPPTISSLNALSEARVDLTWQVVPGATNYKLFHSIGPNGPWTQIVNKAVPYSTLYCGKYALPTMDCNTQLPVYSSYADTGLTENTSYCYQIKAWNSVVGDSAAGATVCASTLSLSGPSLTIANASLTSRTIQLGWTYNPTSCSPTPCFPTPDGFEIWRLAMNGEWALVTTTPNVTQFTDRTNIEPQKSYSYKVRAIKGSEVSTFSNVLGANTQSYSSATGTCP